MDRIRVNFEFLVRDGLVHSDRVIGGAYGEVRDPDSQYRVGTRCISVISVLRGVSPALAPGRLVNIPLIEFLFRNLLRTYCTALSNSCKYVTFSITSKSRSLCFNKLSLCLAMSFLRLPFCLSCCQHTTSNMQGRTGVAGA